MEGKRKLNRGHFLGTAAGVAAGAALGPLSPGALARRNDDDDHDDHRD